MRTGATTRSLLRRDDTKSARRGKRGQPVPPGDWRRWWSNVALTCVAAAVVVLIAASIARRDLSVVENSLSYYAIGPWWFLQTAAFLAIGGASAALAIALGTSGIVSRWLALVIAALLVSGAASLGLAIFPMGGAGLATMLGDTHQTAGTVGGVAQLMAALAFVLAIRHDADWRPTVVPAAAAFNVALLGAIATQSEIWWPHLDIPMGAAMRTVLIPMVLLWGLVALRLRNVAPDRSPRTNGVVPSVRGISSSFSTMTNDEIPPSSG